MSYQERTYRIRSNSSRFHYFGAVYRETDLWIGVNGHDSADHLKRAAEQKIRSLRRQLDSFLLKHPGFNEAMKPVRIENEIPLEIRALTRSSGIAGTGPMAGIAGLFSRDVGEILLRMGCREVVVENGGDIFAAVSAPITVAVHAGTSPLSEKVGLRIPPGVWGICTSSGTVGHSISYGRADAVAVVAKDAVTADAMATAVANRILAPENVQDTLNDQSLYTHIEGILVILGDQLGVKGRLELEKI